MNYLIDTNVFSEIQRGAVCNERVRSWWESCKPQDLFLSVLVLGEVQRGISKLERKDPRSAREYQRWLNSGLQLFAGRILGIDIRIASFWGKITSGRSLPVIDSLLAATALCNNMVLVTRNVHDVRDTGVQFLNPFEMP